MKVLKCLHTLCLKCVQHQTSFNGEMVCPACTKPTESRSGIRLLNFLPDCYVDSQGSASQSTASEYVESRVAEEKLCDECVEDTPATSKCADCNAVLCDAHATSHPRSRASYKHNVHKLTSQCEISRNAENQPEQSCLVHTSKAVQSFCTECNELLCRVCDYAHTSDHKQFLLPIAEDAVKAKTTIRAKFGQDASTSPTFLEEKLDAMTTAVDNLQSEVQNTSDKATR